MHNLMLSASKTVCVSTMLFSSSNRFQMPYPERYTTETTRPCQNPLGQSLLPTVPCCSSTHCVQRLLRASPRNKAAGVFCSELFVRILIIGAQNAHMIPDAVGQILARCINILLWISVSHLRFKAYFLHGSFRNSKSHTLSATSPRRAIIPLILACLSLHPKERLY